MGTMAQTGAICVALGKELGFAPEASAVLERKALQLVGDTGDLISDGVGKKGSARVMQWVTHFEAALGDVPFFMGEKLTYVDYTILGAFELFPGKAGKEDFK